MSVDELLVTALDFLDPVERRHYLDRACAGDEPLRREVESLLAAHERVGDFLQKRPALLASASESGAAAKGFAEKPGDRIGRYKLLEQIGEGGMGVVWMAEQEEPVRRRVALKIIKLGMDTREVVARFEAERQALALMDHPNIAKVFDGGATEVALESRAGVPPAPGPPAAYEKVPSAPGRRDARPTLPAGRPYFVMELVRGLPITKYCEERRLSMRERLELVAQVCRAVQHAHQKGIIHRDLKPSNVLVTEQDGRPVPKVIDFGIAKATEGRLTDKTLFTGFQQWIGTPSYMSPEQAGLASLDIDTRSDVYSLGVLLYELLTGRTPFDTQALLKEGYEAVLRTIREVDPPKPSTRLTDLVAADVRRLQTSSSQPSTINPQPDSDRASSRRLLQQQKDLISTIRGDLDWIVMKCLEKDRARRYDTANSLAADLERHLHHEPVLARPPSTSYRLQKFVRKHRGPVAAGAGFVALLGLATAVSMALGLRANRERGRAVKAEAKAEMKAMEATMNAKEAKANADEARAVLSFFQDKVLAAAQPEGYGKGLGRNVTLREALDSAESGITTSFSNQPLVEASIRDVIGTSYLYLGLGTNAIWQHERALALRKLGLGLQSRDTLASMNRLASAYRSAGRRTEALALHEETLKLQTAKLGPDHPATLWSMHNLALDYADAGRLTEALALNENLLKLKKAKLGPDHPDTLGSMNNLALNYGEIGRPNEALALHEETLNLRKAKLGPDHPDTLASMNNLANAYRAVGRRPEALVLYEETLKLLKAKLGPDHPDTLTRAF